MAAFGQERTFVVDRDRVSVQWVVSVLSRHGARHERCSAKSQLPEFCRAFDADANPVCNHVIVMSAANIENYRRSDQQ